MRTPITYWNSVKIPSKLAYFGLTDHARIRKYSDIAQKPNDANGVSSALGALRSQVRILMPCQAFQRLPILGKNLRK